MCIVELLTCFVFKDDLNLFNIFNLLLEISLNRINDIS